MCFLEVEKYSKGFLKVALKTFALVGCTLYCCQSLQFLKKSIKGWMNCWDFLLHYLIYNEVGLN